MFQIKEFTFQYPSEEKNAIQNVNLDFLEGHFYVICGLSGSGKSTLLRCLKPALTPNGNCSGEIYYQGENIKDVEAKKLACEIGFLLQDADAQLVTDTVWHELAFALENLNYPTGQMKARIAETVACFGLESELHKNVDDLSGGQKQLVNLAALMALSPKVLLLDEPLAKLDPVSVSAFMSILQRIHQEFGVTVIMVEQRLDAVLPYATDVVLVEDGIITANAPKTEVSEHIGTSVLVDAMPAPFILSKKISQNSVYTVAEGRALLKEYVKTNPLSKERQNKDKIKGELLPLMKNVCYRYDRHGLNVLNSTTLTVTTGSITSIVGGNGTGKTTILKLLIGALKPQKGKVLYHGRVGYLPQDAKLLFMHDTIQGEFRNTATSEEEQKRLEEYITLFDIQSILNKHPYDVSGGEIERAALVKVLIKEPQLLLLDEPTNGLDIVSKRHLADVLKELAKNGITILLVSHDLSFCAETADTCAMLFAGEIIEQKDAHSFFSNQQLYTTQVAKMTRGLLPDCVTVDDLMQYL